MFPIHEIDFFFNGIRTLDYSDHTSMDNPIHLLKLIDDFKKGNLEPWEQIALIEFISTDPEWFDYFLIELVLSDLAASGKL